MGSSKKESKVLSDDHSQAAAAARLVSLTDKTPAGVLAHAIAAIADQFPRKDFRAAKFLALGRCACVIARPAQAVAKTQCQRDV
jgi:hypothetical protein